MPDIPAPGTWVRLTRAGAPAGSWHSVVGWHPDARSLQLRCRLRDRHVSWALDGQGPWTVARSSEQPEEEACGTCRFREAHATQAPERPAASTGSVRGARRGAAGIARVGRSAWVFMAPAAPRP